jgi:ornithine--oxo-acid transaminase
VMAVFRPGDHGSTFGGNPLAAAVADAALQLLQRDRLAERAADLGDHLMDQLRGLAHPAVLDVRGKGLLVGIEIDPHVASAREVCEGLMVEGVLTKDTHGTVVRLAPPLVVTRGQLDHTVACLSRVLDRLLASR